MEVLIYTTSSLDGRIGLRGRRLVLSSGSDLERLHYYRSIVDAVMVGANTVITDDPLLTVRLHGYRGRQPYRIIIDSRLRTPINAKVYDTGVAPTIVVTSEENMGSVKEEELRNRGVEIIHVGWFRDGVLDLGEALEIIEEKYGVHRVLVEGGGFLIGTLLQQKLVSMIHITITPLLLGRQGIPLINIDLEEPVKLELIDYEIDESTGEIHLVYRPIYNQ